MTSTVKLPKPPKVGARLLCRFFSPPSRVTVLRVSPRMGMVGPFGDERQDGWLVTVTTPPPCAHCGHSNYRGAEITLGHDWFPALTKRAKRKAGAR